MSAEAAVRALEVLDPGPLTTVQDEGRPGSAHLGVPTSGWVDGPAARLANRLVGNDESAAVLETTLGGTGLRVRGAMTVAVTGARAPVSVNGHGREWSQPLSLRDGDRLRVGAAEVGLRCYLAVAGGVAVARVLGSRATDTLSGLGPRPLAEGDVLPVGPAGPTGPGGVDALTAAAYPDVSAPLRLLPGPRDDWFVGGVESLTGRPWRVTQDGDRIGLRLEGEPLERAREDELPSEGLVEGAVQVPASGQPLVFLADHPTTGGYPVVGVVHPGDLPRCAQLRPGDEVRFVALSRDDVGD